MKHPTPRSEGSRFSGHLRHYHRSNSQPNRTWDEWIDGDKGKSGPSVNRLKIAGIVLAVLALGGIVTGLIVELS